ncbi:unnamed protein product [Orchesella dallaii]|uniref:C2H2-type domain-containing protein n=1 Tax=Orchesella dallaii TaxID=48710 RepID=A0ABP1Q1N8_9HEXA
MASDCQHHCYEEVEKMIKGFVSKMSGEVESIYFQEDADYNTNLKNDSSNEPLKHRFLLSFTAPCNRIQNVGSDPDQVEVLQAVTHESGSLKGDNLSQTQQSQNSLHDAHVCSPAPPNRTTPYYELPMNLNYFQDSEGSRFSMNSEDPYSLHFPYEVDMMMHDQLMNANSESETIAVSMTQVETEMVENSTETLLTSPEGAEYTELTNFPGIIFPLSTLSSEELHATIDHQLSKNTPTLKQMEWGNQLFNNLNHLSSETDKNKLSPQQQSSEVSSSSGTFLPVSPTTYNDGRVNPTSASGTCTEESEPQDYISNVTIPYTSLQQLGNHGSMNIIIAGTEILQQEGVAPAKLPAVSSLFSTGSYSNFSWTSVENKAPPVQQVVRVAKHFPIQRHTSGSRPTLLLPKPKSVSMTNAEPSQATILVPKTRSRKKSPLKKNKEPAAEEPQSQSMFSDTPSNAPKGHTYESWILQEGLYKVRKQGSHKTDDKDFYPYACPACDKRYKNPNGIKYHAKYAHGPKCVYVCDTCKREYSTKHGLAAHKRIHIQTFSPPRAEIRASDGLPAGSTTIAFFTSATTQQNSAMA